jgi:hypothetical protein
VLVKGEVNSVYAMKAHGKAEIQIQSLLTSALDVDELSALHPGHFTPRENALGTH